MITPVPTRAALRALARLCHPETVCASYHSSCVRAPLRDSHGTRGLKRTRQGMPSLISAQSRSKTTFTAAPEPHTFANDPSRYDPQHRTGPEPAAQGTVDPQSVASGPVLPDISNYYTLFPKTIPNGPPQAPSRVPDSSALVDREPSQASFHITARELRKEFLHL